MKDKCMKKRKLHYDILRILAAFSIVMLHSAAQHWYTLDIYSTEWMIANSYDAVFRFGVPLFVMISGALFLNPESDLKISHLYKRNILRFIVLYMVWSCLYGLWGCRTYDFVQTDWKSYFRAMIQGSYHLWFLPMIVGIYLIVPILRTWVHHADEKNLKYFVSLFLVLQIGRESLRAVTVTDELHEILDLVQVEMVCGYVGYFVWGYYLAYIRLSGRIKKWIYIAFVPGILANVILSNGLTRHYGTPMVTIYDSYGIFTFLIVTGLFVFAQDFLEGKQFSNKSRAVIEEVSADTLGIYVMHIGLLQILQSYGMDSMMLPNIVGIPLLSVICFLTCMFVAAILRRIPVIGKYIC